MLNSEVTRIPELEKRCTQAAEQDNVNRINVESARRQVLQAISQAWNQLLGARANLVSDEEQVKSDAVAFDGVTQEQKKGQSRHSLRRFQPQGDGNNASGWEPVGNHSW